jgi:hypothetical protein
MRGLKARTITLGALGACAVLSSAGCEDQSYRSIGAQINIIARRDDGLVPPAQKRLVAFGPRALPQIETALHTAPLRGRLRLVQALDAIGDEEAVPILRHFAVYDADQEIRRSCEAVLRAWAVQPNTRASKARQALARITERRARGEGPLGPRAQSAR